jgi:hypothetical protein
MLYRTYNVNKERRSNTEGKGWKKRIDTVSYHGLLQRPPMKSKKMDLKALEKRD